MSAVASGLIAIGVLAVPGAAHAAEPDPVLGGAVFNDPAGTIAQQNAIFQQTARLIDRVPAGAELRLSMFHFDPPKTADTAEAPDLTKRLIAAHRRNVAVKVVLDQQSRDRPGKAAIELQQALGSDDASASFVVFCDDFYKVKRGCIGTRTYNWPGGSPSSAHMHNKFMAISRLTRNDGSSVDGVVYQASANMTLWDANEGYNNGLTVVDPALYDEYVEYHKDLVSHRRSATGNNNYYHDTRSASLNHRAFFYPREEEKGEPFTESSTDNVLQALNSVQCAYKDEKGIQRQTDIRVMQMAFNRTPIAAKLVELRDKGCWVDVVSSDYSKGVLDELDKEDIQVTNCSWTLREGIDVRVHHKYMLIDGRYDDDIDPRTFTGSHNFVWASLRLADEALIRVKGRATHEAYLDNFWAIRDTCRAKGGEIA